MLADLGRRAGGVGRGEGGGVKVVALNYVVLVNKARLRANNHRNLY